MMKRLTKGVLGAAAIGVLVLGAPTSAFATGSDEEQPPSEGTAHLVLTDLATGETLIDETQTFELDNDGSVSIHVAPTSEPASPPNGVVAPFATVGSSKTVDITSNLTLHYLTSGASIRFERLTGNWVLGSQFEDLNRGVAVQSGSGPNQLSFPRSPLDLSFNYVTGFPYQDWEPFYSDPYGGTGHWGYSEIQYRLSGTGHAGYLQQLWVYAPNP